MKIAREPYGTTKDGKAVDIITIENSNGYSLQVITYGAYLVSFKGPDKTGKIEELTRGYDNLEAYLDQPDYHGATVGRYANRIRNNTFSIDGETYQLNPTNDTFQLHGGPNGFNTRIWEAFPIRYDKRASVKLTLTSPDGDQGYPGTLDVALTITLTEENELFFLYEAVSDKKTYVSLTNHTYWNLSGRPGEKKIYDQLLQIKSEKTLTLDENQIPTGEFSPVAGTIFDFSKPKKIGDDILSIDSDPVGYDHNFVMSDLKGVQEAASILDPESGRFMTVLTDAPGIQFYSDNHDRENPHTSLCLEAGELPDAMNHENFFSPLLEPGQLYRQVTIHSFTVID